MCYNSTISVPKLMCHENVSKDIDFYCVLDYNNEYKKKRSSDLIRMEMI